MSDQKFNELSFSTAVKALAHCETLKEMLIPEEKSAEYTELYKQKLKELITLLYGNLGLQAPEHLLTF